ncbi:DNA-3-methyladenine glycosylase [Patescibacteria group bacterium]|nr:DNA-3-methyladenine glycosylase [Patescibacteria group bacterium]
MRLRRNFFKQKTLTVARDLLGCFLIRKLGQKKVVAQIIETEAYCGPKDLASHAAKGRTKRTEVMFGLAGYAYVYLIYGMYYCFNIVTERENYPAAVLVRAIKIDDQTIIGPGKVCQVLKIDKTLNNVDLVKSNKLWLEKNPRFLIKKVKRFSRVNINYAKEYKDKPWRFVGE